VAVSDERAYVVVDVFADVPLEGNPVAVFLDGRGLEPERMQRTAGELNLSETVFLLPDDELDARVRIFTPRAELPFAGHPILGAAFVVAGERGRDAVRLRAGAGVIPVALRREAGRLTYGEMEQPIPRPAAFDGHDALLAALGVARPAGPIVAYENGPVHVYVPLEHEREVASLRPDLRALASLGGRHGFSCFAVEGRRVRTRMFAPALGVAEDPATGSAAGPLALHLARTGEIGFGEEIEIHQGREIGRPSVLRARAEGSRDRLERVVVGGGAVVVARGTYRLA